MPPPKKGGNRDDKDDRGEKRKPDRDDNKKGNSFLDVNNEVAVLFGGHSSKESRRQQKMTDRQVMLTQSPTPTYYQWCEQPISFSRADHWCDFDTAGRYPLVISPIVKTSVLHKALVDGGSGLNILFAKTPKVLGLSAEDLESSDTPFYGIIPGRGSRPLGHITLPITFSVKDNYRSEYIKFEVADIDCSYNAILGRLALAKFMAVPHHSYLVLKMPAPNASSPSRATSKSTTSATGQRSQQQKTSSMRQAARKSEYLW